jgi:hypothetical protein
MPHFGWQKALSVPVSRHLTAFIRQKLGASCQQKYPRVCSTYKQKEKS